MSESSEMPECARSNVTSPDEWTARRIGMERAGLAGGDRTKRLQTARIAADYLKHGMAPFNAAVRAARECVHPIATTTTLPPAA